ncbi:MAG: HEAT repeat domain-containing protein [Polyangiaceae bacterium]
MRRPRAMLALIGLLLMSCRVRAVEHVEQAVEPTSAEPSALELPRPHVRWVTNDGAELIGASDAAAIGVEGRLACSNRSESSWIRFYDADGRATKVGSLSTDCVFGLSASARVAGGGLVVTSFDETLVLRGAEFAQRTELAGEVAIGEGAIVMCAAGVARAEGAAWSAPCAEVAGSSSALVVRADGGLTRLRPSDGSVVWRAPGAFTQVVVAGDLLLARTRDQLLALESTTGARRWSMKAPPGCRLTSAVLASSESTRSSTLVLHRTRARGCGADEVVAIDAVTGEVGGVLGVGPNDFDGSQRQVVAAGARVAWIEQRSHAVLVVHDTRSREKISLAVPAETTGPMASGDDLLLGVRGGIARITLDRTEPPIASLAPEQAVDVVLDDALGPDPALLGAVLERHGAPASERLAERVRTLDEARLLTILSDDLALDEPLADALEARYATARDGDLRLEIVRVLAGRDTASARPVLLAALDDPRALTVAAASLVRIGRSEDLANVAAHLDAAPRCFADPREQAVYIAVMGRHVARDADHSLPSSCPPKPSVASTGLSFSVSITRSDAPVEGAHATADAGLYCGPLCGFGYRVELVYRSGRWFFLDVEPTWGS